MLRPSFLSAILWIGCTAYAMAQGGAKPIEPNGSARPANAAGEYQALRGAQPSGDSVTVTDLSLAREGGVFHFEQGTFVFYGPVNGHITGAVFAGKGQFSLTPNERSEQHSLALLTANSAGMVQEFTSVVLRFTDGTAEEIRAAAKGDADPKAPAAAIKVGVDLARSYRTKLMKTWIFVCWRTFWAAHQASPQAGSF